MYKIYFKFSFKIILFFLWIADENQIIQNPQSFQAQFFYGNLLDKLNKKLVY